MAPFRIQIAFFFRYFAIFFSKIRGGEGKWRVLKELERIVRGLFYGTIQNCQGDAEERHSITSLHYLTDNDIDKVPASNLTTTSV